MATARRLFIWLKMLFGKSELHLKQPVGSFISNDSVEGYYNDLSAKVLFDKKNTANIEYIPLFIDDYGNEVKFPIQIIQYGLGSYELFLKTNDEIFLKKTLKCADFVVGLMENDGGLKCFDFVKNIRGPYSAMCQGEAISLLLRAFSETNNSIYIEKAKLAYNFLVLKGSENGIVSYISENLIYLHEYAFSGVVLNGFIFALFGLFDYFLISPNCETESFLNGAINGLISLLEQFDCDSWSYYDTDRHFSSKFYHELHINLLIALNQISPNAIFNEYIKKWTMGLNNKKMRTKMFWSKAKQKLRG